MVKWLVMMVYDTAADTINAVITIVLFLCEFLLTFDSFYCLWAASLDRGLLYRSYYRPLLIRVGGVPLTQ